MQKRGKKERKRERERRIGGSKGAHIYSCCVIDSIGMSPSRLIAHAMSPDEVILQPYNGRDGRKWIKWVRWCTIVKSVQCTMYSGVHLCYNGSSSSSKLGKKEKERKLVCRTHGQLEYPLATCSWQVPICWVSVDEWWHPSCGATALDAITGK